MIEVKYFFKDEFGQESETRKTYTEETLEAIPAIDLMIHDFKMHLKNCGYNDEVVKEFIDIHFPDA